MKTLDEILRLILLSLTANLPSTGQLFEQIQNLLIHTFIFDRHRMCWGAHI